MTLAQRKTTADAGSDPGGITLTAMDRPIAARRLASRYVAWAIALALIAGVAGAAWYFLAASPTLTVRKSELEITTVTAGQFVESIPVTGTIEPLSTVYLDAIEGGQIAEVFADAGHLVHAGDPLVRLTNTNLQLEVIGREAQLTEQLNNLSTAQLASEQNRLAHTRELIEIDYEIERLERRLRRYRPLNAAGSVAAAEVDDLESELRYNQSLRAAVSEAQRIDADSRDAQIAMLEEAVDAMNRNLALTRENLANLVISAPITGQLTVFDAHVGQSMPAGSRVGQIDAIDAFKVDAFVDEYYLSRVRAAQSATADIDGRRLRLRVARVLPEVRDRQFEIELEFEEPPPGSIRRGQTVRANLELGQAAAVLRLANGDFYDDTGGEWVFVVDPSGLTASRHAVSLGRRSPNGIEIVDGLGVGDRVITSSYRDYLPYDRLILTGGPDERR